MTNGNKVQNERASISHYPISMNYQHILCQGLHTISNFFTSAVL